MVEILLGIGAMILTIGIPYSFVMILLMLWNKEDPSV
tara:strand:- start:186 stop:296 length:111 start_codon:yes stop_codon:yes gene_type:complete